MMATKQTGGSWEGLGKRWSRDSAAPTPRIRTHDYEKPANEGVIYGPKGGVIGRSVDRAPKMGFRQTKED